MTPQQILVGMGVVYGGSEVVLALARHSRANVARGADRGSLAIVWATIALAIFAAVQVADREAARLPGPTLAWALVGALVLLAGLVLRWTAILTLGSAFTVDVAISKDQRLIEHGLYGVLRHPSYTGNLVAFLGLALALGDWLAGLVLLVPILVAFLYRIRVEERALRSAFGADYERYCRRTRRLVPFLY